MDEVKLELLLLVMQMEVGHDKLRDVSGERVPRLFTELVEGECTGFFLLSFIPIVPDNIN